MDVALSIILSVAWVSGAFPVSCPLPASKYFRTSFFSLATLYAVIIVLIGIIIQLDTSEVVERTAGTKNLSQAKRITLAGWTIIERVHPIAIRLIGILYGTKITKMITSLNQVSKFSQQSRLPLIVLTSYLKSAKIKQGMLYFVITINTGLNVFSLFEWISTYMIDSYDDYGPYLSVLLPSWKPLVFIMGTIGSYYGTFGAVLAQWIVVGCGTKLLRGYSEYFSALLVHMHSPEFHEAKDGGRDFARDLFENLVKLKESAAACGEVVGLYVLATLTCMLPQTLHSIHLLIWPQLMFTGYSALLEALFTVMLFVLMGQAIEQQIKKLSEELKNEMVASKIHGKFLSNEFKEVVTAAQEWKLELSAGGMFPINNSGLCTLLGALVTSILFTVQLELAETTSGLQAGTDCGNGSTSA